MKPVYNYSNLWVRANFYQRQIPKSIYYSSGITFVLIVFSNMSQVLVVFRTLLTIYDGAF